MKVLFLDVDGVLNVHEHNPEVLCGQIHPEKVQLLNGVLRATGCRIVLSSAWRYIVHRGEANLAGLEWLFRSHGVIAGRLVGITKPDTMVRPVIYSGEPQSWPMVNERGLQISEWLSEHGVGCRRYAVVDDLDLGISACSHPFVQTDGGIGLTEANADELIRLLGRSE